MVHCVQWTRMAVDRIAEGNNEAILPIPPPLPLLYLPLLAHWYIPLEDIVLSE